jgi:hypothetical protein
LIYFEISLTSTDVRENIFIIYQNKSLGFVGYRFILILCPTSLIFVDQCFKRRKKILGGGGGIKPAFYTSANLRTVYQITIIFLAVFDPDSASILTLREP